MKIWEALFSQPVKNWLTQVSLIFLNFPTEFFEFCFKPWCKIWWSITGALGQGVWMFFHKLKTQLTKDFRRYKPFFKIFFCGNKATVEADIDTLITQPSKFKSSCQEVFCEKAVLGNFAKFTGKYLYQSLFFNNIAGLRPVTLLTKRLWRRCFPVNFQNFEEHLSLQNTSNACFCKFRG